MFGSYASSHIPTLEVADPHSDFFVYGGETYRSNIIKLKWKIWLFP